MNCVQRSSSSGSFWTASSRPVMDGKHKSPMLCFVADLRYLNSHSRNATWDADSSFVPHQDSPMTTLCQIPEKPPLQLPLQLCWEAARSTFESRRVLRCEAFYVFFTSWRVIDMGSRPSVYRWHGEFLASLCRSWLSECNFPKACALYPNQYSPMLSPAFDSF